MINALRTLITRARVSLSLSDSSNFPRTQATWNGTTKPVETIWPYGLAGRAPSDSLLLLFRVNGTTEDRAGIAMDPLRRFKDLADGEVVVGSPFSGANVHFKANGDIEVTGPANLIASITGSATVTAPGGADVNGVQIDSAGNVTIPGTLTVTGGASIAGKDFLTHVHSGVTAGPSNTGGVV